MSDQVRRVIRAARRELAHARTTLQLIDLQRRHRQLEDEVGELRRSLAAARFTIETLQRTDR